MNDELKNIISINNNTIEKYKSPQIINILRTANNYDYNNSDPDKFSLNVIPLMIIDYLEQIFRLNVDKNKYFCIVNNYDKSYIKNISEISKNTNNKTFNIEYTFVFPNFWNSSQIIDTYGPIMNYFLKKIYGEYTLPSH